MIRENKELTVYKDMQTGYISTKAYMIGYAVKTAMALLCMPENKKVKDTVIKNGKGFKTELYLTAVLSDDAEEYLNQVIDSAE